MSRLDDIKEAYDNIQVPAELKERVLQSMERGKKDACGEKKESGKAFAGKSERIQKMHRRVCQIKASEKTEVKYMQAWEEKLLDRQ